MTRDVSLFDRFARAYDAAMPSADSAVLAEGLAYARRPIERVADVGGGTGRGARTLDAPDRLVVDAARGMLRRVPTNIGTVAGDATRLPLAEDSVDAAIVVDALHHMPDHAAVLAELRRVIRPGGVLVLREFDPTTVRGVLLDAAETLVGFDSTFRPPDALATMARQAGFEVAIPRQGFTYTLTGVVPKPVQEGAPTTAERRA